MQDDLFSRISNVYSKMSKGQKKIADYLEKHGDKAVFLTAAKIAENTGLSESTVVRFATMLGYDGYPKMQRALQETLSIRLTALQRIENSQDISREEILPSVLKKDIRNIQRTLDELDPKDFQNVIDTLLNAKNVYVLGLRSAAPLAQFFGYYLSFILPNVHVIGASVGHVLEDLVRIDKEDVLFAISFPRYSTRTIEAAKFASKRGASVIALTDSQKSPLASVSVHSLSAGSGMVFFADSLVAPMSVINALIVALGMQKRDEVFDQLNELESIWDATGAYLRRSADE